MKYSQITVTTTSQASELVAYFLEQVCLEGVNIVDKSDLAVGNWDYIDDTVESSYDNNVYVIAYANIEDTQSVLLFLRDSFATLDENFCGSLDINCCEVEEFDWVSSWQSNFRPIDFGAIVVCPQWIQCHADKPILLLDNGASFGTGQHETTSMCIKLIAQQDVVGKSILDVGCGSGILALSALLLGGDNATLVDIDPMCVETSLSNAQLNSFADRCDIICGNLCDKVCGKFDIVLANLTADILYMLSKDICNTLHSGSKLILSGILSDRVDKVIECYQSIGLKVLDKLTDGQWCALLLEQDR